MSNLPSKIFSACLINKVTVWIESGTEKPFKLSQLRISGRINEHPPTHLPRRLIRAYDSNRLRAKAGARWRNVRITTELVQTGVVVLDKQGRFVEGLRKDQFILKVDGQQVDPSFFEQVTTGSTREEKLERSMGSSPMLCVQADLYSHV